MRGTAAPGGGSGGGGTGSFRHPPCRSSASDRSSRASCRASARVRPSRTSSATRSSRCSDSSSMIPASSAGGRLKTARRRRSSWVHSDMFELRDAADGVDEVVPRAAVRGQLLAPERREFVEPAPALTRALDPAALSPAAVLEPVEKWIERRDLEADAPVGALVDQL